MTNGIWIMIAAMMCLILTAMTAIRKDREIKTLEQELAQANERTAYVVEELDIVKRQLWEAEDGK